MLRADWQRGFFPLDMLHYSLGVVWQSHTTPLILFVAINRLRASLYGDALALYA